MQSSISPTTARPRRILIVRLSAHGDVIHTLPLLAALKRQDPSIHIGWLVEAAAAPLLEGHPLIDCLHVSPRKRWLKLLRNPLQWARVWAEFQALREELRAEHYEVSLDVQGLLKSALWPWLSGIPVRWGYQAARERADRFYTRTLPPLDLRNASISAVVRTLDFARAIGDAGNEHDAAPEFVIPRITAQATARVNDWLATERPLVVLAPFTRWPSKHWQMAGWPIVIAGLVKMGLTPVILGAPGDQAATTDMLAAVPTDAPASVNNPDAHGQVINLVGRTDWPDLYALFARTWLVIGLDSAPLHVANAVGVPYLLGIYGPTAPGRTGPIGPKARTLQSALPCQPCFERICPLKTHECMQQVTPTQVLDAVRQWLPATEQSQSGISGHVAPVSETENVG